jgi:hypothetical protein
MTWIPDTNDLAPGVTIERRAIFWVPLAVATAVLRARYQARRIRRSRPQSRIRPSFRGVPFAVIQWRMAPHAILPAHCHPQATVCTVGIEGEARGQIVSPRRIRTLSSTRDNIHYFEAGDAGARGLDITTGYGGDGSFSFVAFQPDKPKDPKKQLFEAVWTGMQL